MMPIAIKGDSLGHAPGVTGPCEAVTRAAQWNSAYAWHISWLVSVEVVKEIIEHKALNFRGPRQRQFDSDRLGPDTDETVDVGGKGWKRTVLGCLSMCALVL